MVRGAGIPTERLLDHARIVRRLREQRWPISRTFHFEGDQMLRLLPTLASVLENVGPDSRRWATECTGRNRERVLAELLSVIARLDGWSPATSASGRSRWSTGRTTRSWGG